MAMLLTVFQWLTGTTMGISTIVIFLVGLLVKFMPRDKLWAIVKPSAIVVGAFINVTLLKFLPKKAAVTVEEGVICSLLYVIRMWSQEVESVVLADNVLELDNKNVVIEKRKSLIVTKEDVQTPRNDKM